MLFFFFFSSRRRHTRLRRDWSSDVCSSDLKPSKEIFNTDKIGLRKNQINYQFTINNIPSSRVGAKLVQNYRTDFTLKEQFNVRELLKYSKDYYRKKGVGRPTKKDRRDIDDFNDENE